MSKSYNEMLSYSDFKDRLEYLSLSGKVGMDTFGRDRYLNQALYQTSWWKQVRNRVIVRDEACDLAIPDHPIIRERIIIHHINPITVDDILSRNPRVFDLNNLVATSNLTHQAIHYGDAITKEQLSFVERKPNDTCPWKGGK